MTTYVYRKVLNQAQKLTPDEQLRLVEELVAFMRQQGSPKRKHSILELEGLGQEIWKGIDAQEYINQERASWD